jgi:hypothetical protein
MEGELAKLGASLIAILALAWFAKLLKLGGDVRIRDAAHARALANEAVYGFAPTDIVLDKAGIGALLKDAGGRQMLIRRHGAGFVGRLLDRKVDARLDRNFLTIGTGEKTFGKVTLDLGEAAQYWAAGLRHLPA